MKPMTLILAASLLPLALSAGEPSPPPPPPPMPPMPAAPGTAPPTATMSTHVMLDEADVKWGDAPPAFERGAQVAVLSGDPAMPGPFVIRIKAPAGYKVGMHWHPSDEQVTVLSGDFILGSDEPGASAMAHTLGPGGFALMPARMHHSASTRRGCIVQVAGMGPFEINYIDPKDDPRLRTPAR